MHFSYLYHKNWVNVYFFLNIVVFSKCMLSEFNKALNLFLNVCLIILFCYLDIKISFFDKMINKKFGIIAVLLIICTLIYINNPINKFQKPMLSNNTQTTEKIPIKAYKNHFLYLISAHSLEYSWVTCPLNGYLLQHVIIRELENISEKIHFNWIIASK